MNDTKQVNFISQNQLCITLTSCFIQQLLLEMNKACARSNNDHSFISFLLITTLSQLQRLGMARFDKASPALVEILNKLQSAETPADFDHNLYEYGYVRYNVQASASTPEIVHLSIWIPPIHSESSSDCLPSCTLKDIRIMCPEATEIAEPSKQGFLLTLKINFTRLPRRKEDHIKAINEISSLHSIIMISQLKDMLWNIDLKDMGDGICKPVKIVYQPREPFFVIKMPEKSTVIYPMRFRDDSDVILATSFFQELVDVSNSAAYSKAPRCTWSPIPPPELRGESFQYLTTNGGFVSFEIFSQHIRAAKTEDVVRSFLTFMAYVKYHVKCTKGFMQRKMRQRQEILSEIIRNARIGGDDARSKHQAGHKHVKKLMSFSKPKMFRKRRGIITNQIKKFHFRIRIKWLLQFRLKWLRIPSLRKSSSQRQ